jgi:hypothetical protein
MNASEIEIREASSAADMDAAATLMVDYLTWGSEQLLQHYGVSEAPASASAGSGLASTPWHGRLAFE